MVNDTMNVNEHIGYSRIDIYQQYFILLTWKKKYNKKARKDKLNINDQ